MKLGTHFFAWFVIIGLTIIGTSVLTQPSLTAGVIAKDVAEFRRSLGEEDAKAIVARSKTAYRALFLDSGMPGIAYNVLHTDDAQIAAARGTPTAGIALASMHTNNWVRNVWLGGYKLLLRINALLVWAPALLPFVLAAFVDGMLARRRKDYTFGYTDPVKYNIATHMMVIVVGMALCTLMAPLSIHALALPLIGIAIAIPITVLMANFQSGR